MRKLTDYAFVILTHMVRDGRDVFPAQEIADATRIPAATSAKVLKQLAAAGIVRSKRGARGGYVLDRPAADIDLVQVIEALEGPLGLTECAVHTNMCGDHAGCQLTGHWPIINKVVRTALSGVSLAEISGPPSPAVMQILDLQAARNEPTAQVD